MKKISQIIYDRSYLIPLIILICLCSILMGLMETVQRFNILGRRGVYLVHEKEMERFKMNLPEKGVVAYVTDSEYDLRTLNLLQYALSPLILLHGGEQERIITSINGPSGYEQFCRQYPETEYIVGNFSSKIEYNNLCENNDVELIDRMDDRIVLFRRAGKSKTTAK